MTLTLTLPMVAFIISLLTGWTGFLLGAIKWLLNRQLTGLEAKVSDAGKKAAEALTSLNLHKESFARDLAGMRLEFNQKATCSNHTRMDLDNTTQFTAIHKMNGSIHRIDGKLDSLINSMDLLMTHHISGGK